MKPHYLEFIYLEREDSYTHVVVAKFEFKIKSFEAWKEEGLGLLDWNFLFKS